MALVLKPAFCGFYGVRFLQPHMKHSATRARKRRALQLAQPARACLSTEQAESYAKTETGPSNEKLSKSEQMALMLGRNLEEEREKSIALIENSAAEKRQNIIMALVATAIAFGIHFYQKQNPFSDLNVLQLLELRSAPIESVGNGKPTVIEFYATWCENCIAMALDMFNLENKYAGKLNFIVVDGDKPENEALMERFEVDGVPQFTMLDKNGIPATTLTGKIPKSALNEEFDALLNEKELPYRGIDRTQLFPPQKIPWGFGQ